ncbi:hypothetical protein [Streptomyces buecherae]|uniref:hypothetical protein n=1 Tax=Streptomyces buecherae TaxID=2763006 RepID=UPI0036BDA739
MSTEPTTPTPPHDWIPSGGGVRWTRVGELGWHAFTLPIHRGDRVLAELGEDSGAVIQMDGEQQLTWLIEPWAEAVRHLREREGVTLAGDDGSYLFVPGMARARLCWWRVAPEPGRLLTDAGRLAEAYAVVRRPGGRTAERQADRARGGVW